MHATSSNQIADILHHNDKSYYLCLIQHINMLARSSIEFAVITMAESYSIYSSVSIVNYKYQ